MFSTLCYSGPLGPFQLRISHIEISPVQISHFSCTNLTFLQCIFHISPVQISHFSRANLTFLQYKFHISPVQISIANFNPAFQILCAYLIHMLILKLHFEQVAGVSRSSSCTCARAVSSCGAVQKLTYSGSEDDESDEVRVLPR